MEAAHSTAGHGDKKAGEDILPLDSHRCGPVLQAVPELGDAGPFDKQAYHHRHCHKQQSYSEQRIYTADEFIDGEQSCNDVITQDNQGPDEYVIRRTVTCNISQDESRTVHEYRAHHKQQHGGKEQDKQPAALDLGTYYLGIRGSSLTDGKHTRKIVVDSTRKDTAQHYPQVARRAELGAHNGSEDRPGARNVQELDHIHLPRGHGHIIHTVAHRHGRRNPSRISPENLLDHLAVNEVADNQGGDTDKKREHTILLQMQKR